MDGVEWINKCGICQKIKYRRDPHWEDDTCTVCIKALSVDTHDPLPEDENGNKHVILIVDDFSKFVGLYPSRSTTSEEFARALLQWVAVFGVPTQIRTDGETQFNSNLTKDLQSLLNYQQLIVVPSNLLLMDQKLVVIKKGS
jgi:hypothetical protein